jgi:hypothetical protein
MFYAGYNSPVRDWATGDFPPRVMDKGSAGNIAESEANLMKDGIVASMSSSLNLSACGPTRNVGPFYRFAVERK